MNNASMEEVYKYEAETLRKKLYQCADLLFKYGHMFDKEDRDKAIDLVCEVEGNKVSKAIMENVIRVEQCK